MRKIIVVSTSSNSDSYGSRLAQHFTKGANAAGMEVEIISLAGKTMEQAYEIGKRLSAPAPKKRLLFLNRPLEWMSVYRRWCSFLDGRSYLAAKSLQTSDYNNAAVLASSTTISNPHSAKDISSSLIRTLPINPSKPTN